MLGIQIGSRQHWVASTLSRKALSVDFQAIEQLVQVLLAFRALHDGKPRQVRQTNPFSASERAARCCVVAPTDEKATDILHVHQLRDLCICFFSHRDDQ